jgi:predicted CoA-binding protein
VQTIDNLVQDFLAQKVIAVVGVSDRRETGSNRNYNKFKDGMMRRLWKMCGFLSVIGG